MKLALSYMRCSSTILPSRQRGIINKVKVTKRRAYGLPTFTGFRDRVLVACR
jgi:transposase